MRKIFVLAFLTMFLGNLIPLYAQEMEAPNYESIRKITCNSKSPSYYPLLMHRFVECDTTLTLEDYRCLYYGFTLREDYIPYQGENAAVAAARKQLGETGANPDFCPEAIKIAEKALQDNPFDLIALSIIPICYLQIGDSEKFHIWDIKLHGILDAIGSSGDGETAESAFHVINVEHEYEILNRLGLELDHIEATQNKQTDFMCVKENADNIKGRYFNYSACGDSYRVRYK